MAYARIIGKDEARAAAAKTIAKLKAQFAAGIETLVIAADHELKVRTPVYTGQAVRNYIWSRDVPNEFIFPAIDNGPTGHTNSMRLGEEPRRRPNEDAAAESLLSLGITQNPFGVFYCSNVSPDIAGLEAGTLPGPPLRSRSPNGMFSVTEALLNTLVSVKGLI